MSHLTICYCHRRFDSPEKLNSHIDELKKIDMWNDHVKMHVPNKKIAKLILRTE